MIHEKLYHFQAEVGRLKKDKKNPHFKNSYVDINSVLEEIMPILHDLKLVVFQPLMIEDGKNVLNTSIIDIEDDTSFTNSVILPEGLDAQKTGSAITYFRRYSLVSLLGLQTVDDDGKAGGNAIKDSKHPSKKMLDEIIFLMNNDKNFTEQWLNFLNVKSFDKATYSQIEKAIKQLS